jgi:hypothetical protein
VSQAVGERLFQYLVSIMLRAVDWESSLKGGKLTVSSLKYEISTTADLIAIIREIVEKIEHRSGGEIIDVLMSMRSLYQSSSENRDLVDILLTASFEPIVDVLLSFALTGSIEGGDELFHAHHVDEYGILVIEEIDSCPTFLEDCVKSILEAGRCAGILAKLECLPQNEVQVDVRMMLDKNYTAEIFQKIAHNNANKLFENLQQPIRYQWTLIHQYCLIGNSGWFGTFLDSAIGELDRPVKSVNRLRINEAIRTAIPSGGVRVTYHTFPIEEVTSLTTSTADFNDSESTLQTIKALTLDLEIEFPLSLVFTKQMELKYQTIFRHFSFCRYVGSKLGSLWIEFQRLKTIGDGCVIFSANMLLQRMIFFVNTYLFHVNIDIVAVEVASFESTTEDGRKDIHSYSRLLSELLDKIMEKCFIQSLTLRSINKVLSTCALFSIHMTRFISLHATREEDGESNLIAVTQGEKYLSLIEKFDDAFQGQLNSLLVHLRTSGTIGARQLITRLDFTGFFESL